MVENSPKPNIFSNEYEIILAYIKISVYFAIVTDVLFQQQILFIYVNEKDFFFEKKRLSKTPFSQKGACEEEK